MANRIEWLTHYFEFLGFGTWKEMLETSVLMIGAGITGFVLSEVFVYLWEMRLNLSSGLKSYREKLEGRLPAINKFAHRHSILNGDLECINETIKGEIEEQSAATAKLREIQEMQGRCVRLIGQPVKSSKRYRAILTNSYVKDYVGKGLMHPVLDSSWAKPQIIEVWAQSKAFALLTLRERYNQSQGFSVDKIGLADDCIQDTDADNAKAEPMPGRTWLTRNLDT